VTNENVPKTLGSILSILADENINVIDILNKSRDAVAYNLIDIDMHPDEEVLSHMRQLNGVINVRMIGDSA
jgi:D-3-phosphoglycerate dehydrogenase